MMAQYHTATESTKEEYKNRVIRYVVNQWALNNGILGNISYNPNSLALYLDCSISDIQLTMQENLLTNRMWDKDRQEEIINSIIGVTLTMAMEDRMEAASQVEILKQSQNGHYVPFISSELRQTLDLKMKAGTNMLSVIKGMSGGTMNIFNQYNQQNNLNNAPSDVLSKSEALELVSNATKLALPSNDATLNYLDAKYNFLELPEVCAKGQDTNRGDREGLDLVKTELLQITDNYKIHRGEPEEVDFHYLRRELEMEVDDSEDPEFNS